ncbi:hypothetical protein C0993_001299 [Termitomyces sp. T159_Od127]|nr:hypothetical protein C0993_001299 [Termitomyces sp. T159_Od127]
MSNTDSAASSIQAISNRGMDWKHNKFNRNSPTANFTKWSKSLKIHLSLLSLKFYVFPTLLPAPKASAEPIVHQNWTANNNLAWAVILTALDETKYEGLDDAMTAANLYAAVKKQVEGKGLVWMVSLIQEVLRIQCSPSELLTGTATHICNIVNRISAI